MKASNNLLYTFSSRTCGAPVIRLKQHAEGVAKHDRVPLAIMQPAVGWTEHVGNR
jgi:hypothetical protein